MKIGTVRNEESRAYDSHAGYLQFHAPETQESFGSFEVFWDDAPQGGWTGEYVRLLPLGRRRKAILDLRESVQ